MLVETRREDFAPAQGEAADQGGAALRDLIAAALVSHEAIGDPDRLAGGEPAALRALCRHVAGPIYRIAPYHYAFAAGSEAAAALVARLAAELGPEALWIAALDHLAADPIEAPEGPAEAPEGPPEAALLVLRARETATAAGLAAAGPELQAVIDARYAVECARLTAAAAAGLTGAPAGDPAGAAAALTARLDGIEARIEAGLAALAEEAARSHAAAAAREEAFAARLAALAAFEERVGLALAEFLARLERREAEAAPEARTEAAETEAGR